MRTVAHWILAPLNVIVVWQRWHCVPNWPKWMSSGDGRSHNLSEASPAPPADDGIRCSSSNVCPSQREVGLLAMIELPHLPAIGAMAGRTVATQIPLWTSSAA